MVELLISARIYFIDMNLGEQLSDYQRSIAQHRIAFDDILSPELGQALFRASLACAENGKKETGIIEFFCGLYLHYQDELADHFRGDFAAAVSKSFPKHRIGKKGLFPEIMLDSAAEGDSCSSGFMYNVQYSDDLLRLLWLSATIANAVGKKPSLKDVVAAFMLDQRWIGELRVAGFEPKCKIANFREEVETVVFHATPHSTQGWPREFEFQHNGSIHPPFTLEALTPSGAFQPVRSAKVRLNGGKVAEISSPGRMSDSVHVELLKLNKIEIEIDGPNFGSMEITIRGTRA
jgi:hypothetical protein